MVTGTLRKLAAPAMCAGALCVMSPLPTGTAYLSAAAAMQPAVLVPASLMRAGFEPPAADGQTLLLSVTAADIDADGDLDVVGSDGSLDLIVWANDGTGHLTRRYPKRSSPGGWSPAGETVDGQPMTSIVLAQLGALSLDLSARTSSSISTPSQWRAPPATSSLQPQSASTRTPRAPPFLLFLQVEPVSTR